MFSEKQLGGGIFTWKPMNGWSGDISPSNTLYQAYRANSVAAACVRMIATSAPEAPARVYLRDKDGQLDYTDRHWFMELMRHPNDWMSTYDLWEQTFIHMLGAGSAYWLLNHRNGDNTGRIDEIRLLRPDQVSPIIDDNGNLIEWEYTPGSGKMFRYPVWQVLAFQLPDPFAPYRGLSPMAQALEEAGVDNAATDFVKQFFDNNGVVAGILSSDQTLEPDEAEAMEERWYQKFSRKAKGLFKTVVLGKGAQYQQLALNFKDMEFESVRSMTETRICMAFGVDPLLLPSWVGLKHNNTKASYQEARRHLWEETIVPLMRRIEHRINSQVFVYEEGVEMHFDLNEVEALQENTTEKWRRYLDAWDKGAIKLGDLQKSIGIPVDDDRREEYKTSSQPYKMARESDEDERDGEPLSKQGEQAENALKLEKKDVDESDMKRLRQVEEEQEERIRAEMRNFFGETGRKVVEESEKYTDIVTAYIAIRDALAQAEAELGPLALDLFRAAAIAGGQAAKEIFGIDFDPEDTELARRLKEYAEQFTTIVMGGVREDLDELVDTAYREGWEMDDIRRELEDTFERYNENKVDRIARTEGIRLTNLGTVQSYIQSGYTRMAWFTHEDDKTCPFCNKMDGTVTNIGAPFAENGQRIAVGEESMTVVLGDILHPPLHPNCRCSVIPEI